MMRRAEAAIASSNGVFAYAKVAKDHDVLESACALKAESGVIAAAEVAGRRGTSSKASLAYAHDEFASSCGWN